MKKTLFFYLAAMLLIVTGCNSGDKSGASSEPVSLKTNEDKLSYSIGLDAGNEIMNTIRGQGMDSLISKELLVRGLQDAILGQPTALRPDSAKLIIRDYFMRKQNESLRQFEPNRQEGERFLQENKQRPEVTTTQSGLQYEVIQQGRGTAPVLGDSAAVHYRGSLLDGTEFDSSHKRGQPLWFVVNYGRMIEGWVEAVQLMTPGSKYKFYIPQELGYGDAILPEIKPYSVLVFEMELIEVKPAKK